MKVFLDTNVIASATATRGLCADLFRTVIESHDLVVPDCLIVVLKRVRVGSLQILAPRGFLGLECNGHDR